MSGRPLDEQAAELEALVGLLKPDKATASAYAELLVYIREIPAQFFSPAFPLELATKFNKPLSEVNADLNRQTVADKALEDFDTLVPTSGWLHDYITYTRQTEPPTVFHFFAGLCVVGSTLARRIYFPRGSGDVFPNVNVVLVAPPGKCKKTTACNIAVHLFRTVGGNVLADKMTPESIVEAFKTMQTATGLIYAPEWAAFLGKQQYLEGLVPMLTSLFDCPAVWSSATIMRGTTQLQNVAISHLAATTIDWMQTSVTRDAMAGGFMSRLLFIVQHDTPRKYPFPPPLDQTLKKRLVDGLAAMRNVNGRVGVTPEAYTWYVDWYNARALTTVERHFAGYFERKPDRLLQIAMVMNAAQDPHNLAKNLTLELSTLQHAKRILDWIEYHMPGAFAELSSNSIGDDQMRLLRQLRTNSGSLKHSEWLRMNASRMNADTFRKATETLTQAGMITFDATSRTYYLLPAGWTTQL